MSIRTVHPVARRTCGKQAIRSFLFSNSCRRTFSSSCRQMSHYETLRVPRNATKAQVKSNFYKLSKQYHPDTAKGPQSKEKFQALSEAYTTLSDDRKRRAYDRSLANQNPTPSYGGSPPTYSGFSSGKSSTSQWSYEWTYETRRRGATHAWQNQRRSGGSTYHRKPPPHTSQSHGGYSDPFTSPNVRRATGRWSPPGRTVTDEDRAQNVSSLTRALQVIGLVVIVATLGGGWTGAGS